MDRALFGLVIGLTGVALLADCLGWKVALSVFFMMWGNNISQNSNKRKSSFKGVEL